MKILKEFYDISKNNGVYSASFGNSDDSENEIDIPSVSGGYGELWDDIVSGENPLFSKIDKELYRRTKGIAPDGYHVSREDIKKITGLQIPPVPDGYEDPWEDGPRKCTGAFPLHSIDGINWYPYYARIPGAQINKGNKENIEILIERDEEGDIPNLVFN